MPLSSTCHNCGLSKTMQYWPENFCQECTDLQKTARDKAIKDNTDPGTAMRFALAARAHDIHRGKVDPRFPMSKADYWTAGVPDATESS